LLTATTRHEIDPTAAKAMDTSDLRAHFHVGEMFAKGEIRLTYTHCDIMILGAAVPVGKPLTLDAVRECGTASILDRRKWGS
jgi:4-deoxy-L-threo-5-hexosulose-uronate ketol-isomerase